MKLRRIWFVEVKVVEKQSGVQIKYQEGVKEAVFVKRFLFGQEKTKYLREGLKQVLKWIIHGNIKDPVAGEVETA